MSRRPAPPSAFVPASIAKAQQEQASFQAWCHLCPGWTQTANSRSRIRAIANLHIDEEHSGPNWPPAATATMKET